MNTILWWLGQNSLTVTLAIPLALLGCRLFRDRPAVQHALWLLILLKFITPPLIAWPWNISQTPLPAWTAPATEPNSPRVENIVTSEVVSAPTSVAPSEIVEDVLPVLPQMTEPITTRISEPAPPKVLVVDWFFLTAQILVAVWFAGGLVCLARQIRRIAGHARLVRIGTSVPSHLAEEIATLAAQMGMTPPKAILVKGIHSPFIWSLGRSRLAWPDTFSSETDVARARSIIAHELAHLRRRDHWIAWLELVAGIVCWWNPLFWFVRRRLRETAEIACDAVAIATNSASRREYAELLLQLSSGVNREEPTSVLAVGAGTAATFERRLIMILSDHVSSGLTWRGRFAMIALAMLIVPHWSQGHSGPPAEKSDPQGKEEVVVQEGVKNVVAQSAAPQTAEEPAAVPESVAADMQEDVEEDKFDNHNWEESWGDVNVSGQVVAPDGKPMAGAKVFLRRVRIKRPVLKGITDAEGRYTFQMKRRLGPKRAPNTPDKVTTTQTLPLGITVTVTEPQRSHTDAEEVKYIAPYLVAVAPGYGFGTLSSGDSATLKLTPDIPVTGRVTDDAGQPLAGARVRVRDVCWPRRADDPLNALEDRRRERPLPALPEGEGLDPWLGVVRRAVDMNEYIRARHHLSGLITFGWLGDKPSVYAPLIPAVTTDGNGRFILKGIGADRVADLYVEGVPDKASRMIVVVTRPLEKPIIIETDKEERSHQISFSRADIVVDGCQLQTSLSPGRTIEGIVTDRATSLPVAGVKVIGPTITWLEYPGYDRFFATTDAKGHYRIDGFPIMEQARFVVEVPEDLPYIGRLMHLKVAAGTGSQQVDIPLAKGVWITGKIVDDATGKGLSQSIEYHAFNDNPHLKQDLAAGFAPQFGPNTRTVQSRNDGTFRIRGYPGRGIVTAGGGHDFLEGVGTDKIKGLKREEFYESLYITNGFSPYLRNTTIEVNIPDDVETFDCELRLKKGKSRSVRVVGPDGRPQSKIEASGLSNQIENPIKEVDESYFQVTNLFPGESREVVARFVPDKLIGMAVVTDNARGTVTLKLVPWANVKGRLVDDQGQPRSQGMVIELEDGKLPIHTFNGRNYDKEEFSVDADGRFQLEGLVPGATYRLRLNEGSFVFLGDLTKDFTLETGETRDLGDVKIMK